MFVGAGNRLGRNSENMLPPLKALNILQVVLDNVDGTLVEGAACHVPADNDFCIRLLPETRMTTLAGHPIRGLDAAKVTYQRTMHILQDPAFLAEMKVTESDAQEERVVAQNIFRKAQAVFASGVKK